MTRYAMAIDVEACAGCQACTIACKSNNNLPIGMLYTKVVTEGGAYNDTATGTYPYDLHKKYFSRGCMHCSNAPCVEVCPTGATYVREDGIVAIDAEKCIGCQACIAACPFGARTLNAEEPVYVLDFALGDPDAPVHLPNTVEKCTFCANRIDRGAKPACMELCPGRARYWGDIDDPESEISRFLEGKQYERLGEEFGTEPNVYYVVNRG